jgi:hypothetical protein
VILRRRLELTQQARIINKQVRRMRLRLGKGLHQNYTNFQRSAAFALQHCLQMQSHCVRCGAYIGFIERMRQIVCIDRLTEMVAEGEC